MPGPLPKQSGRRQRTNSPSLGVVLAKTDLPIAPPVETDWLACTKTQWEALWAHPITATYDRALHEPVLRRLFCLRDERERFRRAVRKTPLIEGSQGQLVLNPLRREMATMDTEIRNLEDRFGLNVSSLLKLGISFGQAKRSLDDLARGLYDDDEDQGDEIDPRLVTETQAAADS